MPTRGYEREKKVGSRSLFEPAKSGQRDAAHRTIFTFGGMIRL